MVFVFGMFAGGLLVYLAGMVDAVRYLMYAVDEPEDEGNFPRGAP